MSKLRYEDLPPEARERVGKMVSPKIRREQIVRVAAVVMKATAETDESLAVQRKALALALRWLKTR